MNHRLKSGALSSLAAFGAVAAQTLASNPIVGDWESGSKAFYSLKLEISDRRVLLGGCSNTYLVIADEEGYGPGTKPKSVDEKWRKIAIELLPEDGEPSECRQFRVLVFSIPDRMKCHADIAIFRDREDFSQSKQYSWGVWGNEKCLN